MKKLIVALLFLLGINVANADEISVVTHGFSKHLDNHNFNERNYGVGIRYEREDYGLQIGAYRNSLYKDAVYVGVDWNAFQYSTDSCLKFEAGPFYGLATGYKYDVTPIVGLQSAVKCDRVFLRVRAIPDLYYNSKVVGSLELGFVISKF